MKVVYKGRDSKLRHSGRTHADYVFHRGIPVVIDDEKDAEFFKTKAKNNPETWGIVQPESKKKTPKKAPAEEPPEEEAPAEEKAAEETPPEEDPKPKAPAKKEGEE